MSRSRRFRSPRPAGARVWVTSGSDAKLERARLLGADDGINHHTTDVAKEVRSRTGKRGVDVVIDCVGEATWASSLGSLGKRGRLVTCGGTSGHRVETDVRRLFWNQWTIMGSTMGSDSEFVAIVAGAPRRAASSADRLAVPARARPAGVRAPAIGGAVRQGRSHGGGPVTADQAQFTTDEQRQIREAVSSGQPPGCPRCGIVLTARTIGGGSFGLGYARRREWLICPKCHRSAIFNVKRGTRN